MYVIPGFNRRGRLIEILMVVLMDPKGGRNFKVTVTKVVS